MQARPLLAMNNETEVIYGDTYTFKPCVFSRTQD